MSAPLIEPEDKQADEQVTIRLRPEIARDLRAYGQYASDSSTSHVVSAALKRLFAADKGFQSFSKSIRTQATRQFDRTADPGAKLRQKRR